MPDPTRAKFTPKTESGDGEPFDVHFNPSSLDYTITNTLQGGNGRRSAQYVAQSTGKLSMELLFDTTHSGEDVRVHTEKVARLMDPGDGGRQRRRRRPPPRALFEWGAYKFEGIVETYREKIDFFSSDGVPLRATVNLTLSRQDQVFESDKNDDAGVSGQLGSSEDDVEARMGSGDDVDDVAQGAGDPGAARDIAASNGFESIRSPGAAVVRLGPEVPLAPPVAFAAGGGLGVGGGVGVSIGAGAGINFAAALGLDVDFSVDVSAGASAGSGAGARMTGSAGVAGGASAFVQTSGDLGSGAPGSASRGGGSPGGASRGGRAGAASAAGSARGAFGSSAAGNATGAFGAGAAGSARGALGAGAAGSARGAAAAFTPAGAGSTRAGSEQERGLASAGVPAAENPFAGLAQGRAARRARALDPERLVRSVEVRGYGTGAGASFRIGGQATMEGAASVGADVGQGVRLADRIRFDRGHGGSER